MTDMTDELAKAQACENTDREIWREREGDYYADSIHVTTAGGIGLNVSGRVIVMPIRDWHNLALTAYEAQAKAETAPEHSLENALTLSGCENSADLVDMAIVGKSLMERIAIVTAEDGPMKGWSPADDPAEIVTDLYSMLVDEPTAPPSDVDKTLAELQKLSNKWGYDDDSISLEDAQAVEKAISLIDTLVKERDEAAKALCCSPDNIIGAILAQEKALKDWMAACTAAQAEAARMREAVKYAHANGFTWPSDPFAALKETPDAR